MMQREIDLNPNINEGGPGDGGDRALGTSRRLPATPWTSTRRSRSTTVTGIDAKLLETEGDDARGHEPGAGGQRRFAVQVARRPCRPSPVHVTRRLRPPHAHAPKVTQLHLDFDDGRPDPRPTPLRRPSRSLHPRSGNSNASRAAAAAPARSSWPARAARERSCSGRWRCGAPPGSASRSTPCDPSQRNSLRARPPSGDRTVIDAFDEHALVERAIDDALRSGPDFGFPGLAEKVGFRDAVRHSVAALRLGGIRASSLASGGDARASRRQALVTAVLRRYEDILEAGGLADNAHIPGDCGQDPAGRLRPHRRCAPPPFSFPDSPTAASRGGSRAPCNAAAPRCSAPTRFEGLPVPKGILWDVAPAVAPGSRLHAVGRHEGPHDLPSSSSRPVRSTTSCGASCAARPDLGRPLGRGSRSSPPIPPSTVPRCTPLAEPARDTGHLRRRPPRRAHPAGAASRPPTSGGSRTTSRRRACAPSSRRATLRRPVLTTGFPVPRLGPGRSGGCASGGAGNATPPASRRRSGMSGGRGPGRFETEEQLERRGERTREESPAPSAP